jgi:hypothetical protein
LEEIACKGFYIGMVLQALNGSIGDDSLRNGVLSVENEVIRGLDKVVPFYSYFKDRERINTDKVPHSFMSTPFSPMVCTPSSIGECESCAGQDTDDEEEINQETVAEKL